MIQLVYWVRATTRALIVLFNLPRQGLEQYTSAEAVGARQGLVAQSKVLLLCMVCC